MSDFLIQATPAPTASSRSKSSSSARIALGFYALLIVYASCYPFGGWRGTGLLPWSWVTESMPRYWTVFDLVVNVIGYVPLGALAVLAMYPRVHGAKAVLMASASGALLATVLECVQNYLPSRVPRASISTGRIWMNCRRSCR